jgi:hypothetical protein
MEEKYNKYHLLIKHGFCIEDLNEMSIMANEIIKKLIKE